jgi:membrane protein
MSKKSFARLTRIVTGAFGPARDETFSFETSLTRFERFVHFWVLVWGSFRRNRCPVRASALSFTTLLALIPMLAVAMSVTTMFLKSKGQEKIQSFVERFVEQMVPVTNIKTNLSPEPAGESPDTSALSVAQPDNLLAAVTASNPVTSVSQTDVIAAPIRDERVDAAQKEAARFINDLIQNAYSGRIGVVGVVFLLWTAIVMLTRVEETFNDIWGVTRGRNWLSRVVLYWATITLGPLLLVGALGLASGSHFQKTRTLLTDVPFLEPVFSQLLPVLVITITFALFYKLMPNTKVHFGAALVGGALAGTAWHLFNVFNLYVGSRAVNASKLYGSLALVPLLMLGLYTVWVIVLFGAQVAYAFQNRESYLQEKLAENVNQRGREFVALRLMTCIGQRFNRGLPPATVPEMSHELGIPSKLVQQVLQTLLAARLLVEISGAESGYSPARPLDAINGHHILLAMRATQGQELVTRDEPVRMEVYGEFARIQAAEKEAASSVTMLALVNRAQARLEIAPPTEREKDINDVATKVAKVTELPNEPANAPKVVQIEEEIKSVSPTTHATTGPMAEVSGDDNQSFPL